MGRFYIRLPADRQVQERWQLVSKDGLEPDLANDPGLLKLKTYQGWVQHQTPNIVPRNILRLDTQQRGWEPMLAMGEGRQFDLKTFEPLVNSGLIIQRSFGYRWRVDDPMPQYYDYAYYPTGNLFYAYSQKRHISSDNVSPHWLVNDGTTHIYFDFEPIREKLSTIQGTPSGAEIRFLTTVTCNMRGSELLDIPYGDLSLLNATILNTTSAIEAYPTTTVIDGKTVMGIRDQLFIEPAGGIPVRTINAGGDLDLIQPSIARGTFLVTEQVTLDELMSERGRSYQIYCDDMPWFGTAPERGYSSYDIDWDFKAGVQFPVLVVRGAVN